MVAHCPEPTIARVATLWCPTATAVMVLLLPKSSVLIFLYSTVEDPDVAMQVCIKIKIPQYSNMSTTADLLDSAIQTFQKQMLFQTLLSKHVNISCSRLRHPDMRIKSCFSNLRHLNCQKQLFFQTLPSKHAMLFFQTWHPNMSTTADFLNSAIQTC